MHSYSFKRAIQVTALLHILICSVANAEDQKRQWPPASWTQTTAPFHIAGPLYYVGGRELSAYLIADKKCSMLVNVGMPENSALVKDSIIQLGFEPEDIEYLLITQAHFDHAGGAYDVVQWSGAEVLAGAADAALMRRGGLEDYVFGDTLPYPAVANARAVSDGERIRCGEVDVFAVSTPGHTPGSTSWKIEFMQDGIAQAALIASSVSVLPNAQLVDNPHYAQVIEDFRNTYQRLMQQEYDYYLPDHMVFIKPSGPDNTDPDAGWFKNLDALSTQIERSMAQLNMLLETQSPAH